MYQKRGRLASFLLTRPRILYITGTIFLAHKMVTSLANFKFIIFAMIAGYICISPSMKVIPRDLIITSYHDNQRLVELFILLLVLLFNIFQIKSALFFKQKKILSYLIYPLITLLIISSFVAASPRHAIIEISIFIGLSYLAFMVADLYIENSALLLKRLINVFLASIFLAMLSFYTGYVTATIFNTPVSWPNPLTGFSNIRSFNQYQLWTFGIITLPLLTADIKSFLVRFLLKSALIAWFVLLFYSASRGALIAFIIGIVITALIYTKIAWPFIRLQLIHISLGFLSYKILFGLIPYLRESAVVTGNVMRGTTYDRLELWSLAINLVKENPILGVGPMHFSWYSKIGAHPHNSVLQLMSEWGLPATLLVLAIAGYGLFCWFKKVNIRNLETKDRTQQNLAIALFFTLTTSAIYSLVDGVIVMPVSQVMMFVIVGLMIGYASSNLICKETTNIPNSIFASIVLITLVWSTLPEILQGASSSEKHFSIGYKAAGPRLWMEVRP